MLLHQVQSSRVRFHRLGLLSAKLGPLNRPVPHSSSLHDLAMSEGTSTVRGDIGHGLEELDGGILVIQTGFFQIGSFQ